MMKSKYEKTLIDDLNIFAPNNLQSEMKMSSAVKRRRIILCDEISRESIFDACFYLRRIMELDVKYNNKKEPIHIDISSYGGTIADGNRMIGLIEHMKENGWTIITNVEGYAMSMGQAIALCGNYRTSFRNSRFMIHALSDGTWGQLQAMENDMEESKYVWEMMKTHIKKYSKITDEQIESYKRIQKNWYFSPEEALALGVIDEII